MPCISFRAGYKYQLNKNYSIAIEILPEHEVDTPYLSLTKTGLLTVKTGYAWDGPSGPTLDTPNFMRGALIHDALYQLIREGHVSRDKRKAADNLLRELCLQDGMTETGARIVYLGVRLGGGPAVDPANERKVRYAPKPCE